jgi:hypothetical protein
MGGSPQFVSKLSGLSAGLVDQIVLSFKLAPPLDAEP